MVWAEMKSSADIESISPAWWQSSTTGFFLHLRRMVGKWAQNLPVADSERGFKYLRWFRHFAGMAARPTDLRFLAADMAAVPPEIYSSLFVNGLADGSYQELPSVSPSQR